MAEAPAPAPPSPLAVPPATKADTIVPQTTGLLRRLVPLASFFIAFCTVMTLLLVYMDTTALRHQQFRVNMTQDYDAVSVAQDDPQLAAYIREVHVRPAADPNHPATHPGNGTGGQLPGEVERAVLAALGTKGSVCKRSLLVYMDTTALRHQQFRVNMTQDYDAVSVAQDDPQLAAYIREVHVRPAADPNHPATHPGNGTGGQLPGEVERAVIAALGTKEQGIFVETGAYKYSRPSDTEWLERNLSWSGLLVQPDPRDYFNLRKHGRGRSQSIHACVSPTCYPKEVTYHQDERDGVKINSVHANSLIDDDWFNTRVKCFPLFSLLLSINCTTVDFLSLDSDGTELSVLETVPFEKVQIHLINVHLSEDQELNEGLKEFMAGLGYKIAQSFKSSIMFIMR